MIFLERPTYPENFDFVDADCKRIAQYLYENTNETFRTALKGNIINTYRTFNDTAIPLTDFPCLKVYKESASLYSLHSAPTSTRFNIAYIVAYAKAPKVADVTSFVVGELVRNLTNASLLSPPLFQLDHANPIDITFDTLIDTATSRLYKYGNVGCSVFTDYF